VAGAAAQLCAALLAACDDVRVLATSREPLAVAGEARYRLGPLALPAPGDAAEGAGAEAVRLFADRARQVDARFALDEQTGLGVATLVTRLDGMPLAIELAAARVEALGVAQLLDRLDDRLALLSAGERLSASRHRSLAATVEWSYRLLDESERRVFRAVSVFPGQPRRGNHPRQLAAMKARPSMSARRTANRARRPAHGLGPGQPARVFTGATGAAPTRPWKRAET
jgi:predicted ATPase